MHVKKLMTSRMGGKKSAAKGGKKGMIEGGRTIERHLET
jgi:hypothetical protein